jgi:hypothetical protein
MYNIEEIENEAACYIELYKHAGKYKLLWNTIMILKQVLSFARYKNVWKCGCTCCVLRLIKHMEKASFGQSEHALYIIVIL